MSRRACAALALIALIAGLNGGLVLAATNGISTTPIGATDCNKEFLTPAGSAVSYVASFVDVTSSSRLCTVGLTPSNRSYIFQPGGLLHVADLNGPGIHSYAMISDAPNRNDLQLNDAGYEVRTGGLNWDFSKKDYTLRGVRDATSAADCLASAASESTVAIEGDAYFDLQSCPSTVLVDLGSSETQQTAALKRNREATVKAEIGGAMKTCQVKIGTLFDYQLNELKQPKQTVIVEASYNAGYNPCVMYASKEFPGLAPNQSIPTFYAKHPDHFCRSMGRATLESAQQAPKPIAAGTSPLQGDRDISYHLKETTEMATAVRRGRGKDCAAIARQIAGTNESPRPLTSPRAGRGVSGTK